MGCSYDVIHANIKKEDKQKFLELYKKILAEDLYDDEWCIPDEDCFEDDGDRSEFGIDAEPLFAMMENGAQLFPFFKAFLAACPDDDFTAEYECTFNNCGAMVVINFSFNDGILTARTKYAEDGYIAECPECGYEDEDGEDLVSLHHWEEGTEITCPECGAVLELDADETVEEINVNESDEYDYIESEDEDDDSDEDE